MTGPGPGKIPVKADVLLITRQGIVKLDPCDVYVHVKGYSRARVTHVDIESPILSIPDEKGGVYARVYRLEEGFRLLLTKPIKLPEGITVREIIVKWSGPSLLEPGEATVAFIGFKEGGIYVGFKKNVIVRLEEFARKRGVPPV